MDLIGVVKTSKGYFLLGGGIEDGETDEGCIRNLQWVSYDCLKENLFVEMQNWALDQCWKVDKNRRE